MLDLLAFRTRLAQRLDARWSLHSRIHSLNHLHTALGPVWVKRDDETGFGISGGKVRKYASLLPAIRNRQADEIVVIGGAGSNHALGMAQILTEEQIPFQLWLRGEPAKRGNALLTRMVVPDSQIRWIPRPEWNDVEATAGAYAAAKAQDGRKVFLVLEGGSQAETVAGACTLMLDILANEEENHLRFDTLLMDAGTGQMAGVTAWLNSLLPAPKQLHVVQMAGNTAYFHAQLTRIKQWLEPVAGQTLHGDPSQFVKLHAPSTAPQFGRVNPALLAEILQTAREEGIFTDPLYNAKLFATARRLAAQQELQGNTLLIHSGGGTSLMAFQDQLSQLLPCTQEQIE